MIKLSENTGPDEASKQPIMLIPGPVEIKDDRQQATILMTNGRMENHESLDRQSRETFIRLLAYFVRQKVQNLLPGAPESVTKESMREIIAIGISDARIIDIAETIVTQKVDEFQKSSRLAS